MSSALSGTCRISGAIQRVASLDEYVQSGGWGMLMMPTSTRMGSPLSDMRLDWWDEVSVVYGV